MGNVVDVRGVIHLGGDATCDFKGAGPKRPSLTSDGLVYWNVTGIFSGQTGGFGFSIHADIEACPGIELVAEFILMSRNMVRGKTMTTLVAEVMRGG